MQNENEIENLIGAGPVLLALIVGFFIGARLGWRYHLYRRGRVARTNLKKVIIDLFNGRIFNRRCPSCFVSSDATAVTLAPGQDTYLHGRWLEMVKRYGFRKKAELWKQYWHCRTCDRMHRVRSEYTIGELEVNEAATQFVQALEDADGLQLVLDSPQHPTYDSLGESE